MTPWLLHHDQGHDPNWKIRWLVVETGSWLNGRQVLLQPSVIGIPDHEKRLLPVRLSKAKVHASPDIGEDLSVTKQMQNSLYDYYDWDPYWGQIITACKLSAHTKICPFCQTEARRSTAQFVKPTQWETTSATHICATSPR